MSAPAPSRSAPAKPAHHSYFPALDGLRAIAFLMVFALHYLSGLLPVTWGWAGVDVFFVLSGFLITGILYDSAHKPNRFYNFYLRRTLRIFPLYYAVFLLLFVLIPVCRWRWNWAWIAWPLYVGNFAVFFHASASHVHDWVGSGDLTSARFPSLWLSLGHFWTLCVEEQFYLVWPFVVFAIRDRRRLIAICIPFLILVPLLRAFADHIFPAYVINAGAIFYATVFHFDALLLGAVIALLRRGPAAARLAPLASRAILLMFPLAILWVVIGHFHHQDVNGSLPLWRLSLRYTLADFLSACIILLALEPSTLVYKALNHRSLRWLGSISYGAYVYHEIPHRWFLALLQPHFHDPRIPTALLALLFTLVLAPLSFRYLESPFIALKQRLTRGPSPVGDPAPAR